MSLGSVLYRSILFLLVATLAACRSASPPPTTTTTSANSGGGRYTLQNDVPLIEPIDLAAIREVIPRIERRTQAGNKNPYTINGRTYRVLQDETGYSEIGVASWYGRKFHGHLTANGEKYDMFQLSAAHTILPIPSYVRVTNLDNGKSIVARVNDRGPFHPGRIVDMSYAGAVLLGYANQGTARVRVESIVPGKELLSDAPSSPQPTAAPVVSVVESNENVAESIESVASERQMIEEGRGSEYLQIGAFAAESSAKALQTRLQSMTVMTVVIHQDSAANGTVLYKVRVGPLVDDDQVQTLQTAVAAARLGSPFRVRR